MAIERAVVLKAAAQGTEAVTTMNGVGTRSVGTSEGASVQQPAKSAPQQPNIRPDPHIIGNPALASSQQAAAQSSSIRLGAPQKPLAAPSLGGAAWSSTVDQNNAVQSSASLLHQQQQQQQQMQYAAPSVQPLSQQQQQQQPSAGLSSQRSATTQSGHQAAVSTQSMSSTAQSNQQAGDTAWETSLAADPAEETSPQQVWKSGSTTAQASYSSSFVFALLVRQV